MSDRDDLTIPKMSWHKSANEFTAVLIVIVVQIIVVEIPQLGIFSYKDQYSLFSNTP